MFRRIDFVETGHFGVVERAQQQPPAKRAFEVASVKPIDANNSVFVGMSADPLIVSYRNLTLRDAIRGAKSRPLGDQWAWSRKSSSVDISPLVAATLALGAAAGVVGNTEVVIY